MTKKRIYDSKRIIFTYRSVISLLCNKLLFSQINDRKLRNGVMFKKQYRCYINALSVGLRNYLPFFGHLGKKDPNTHLEAVFTIFFLFCRTRCSRTPSAPAPTRINSSRPSGQLQLVKGTPSQSQGFFLSLILNTIFVSI